MGPPKERPTSAQSRTAWGNDDGYGSRPDSQFDFGPRDEPELTMVDDDFVDGDKKTVVAKKSSEPHPGIFCRIGRGIRCKNAYI